MGLKSLNYRLRGDLEGVNFFDTVTVMDLSDVSAFIGVFEANGINVRGKTETNSISLSIDETTHFEDIVVLLNLFSKLKGSSINIDSILKDFTSKNDNLIKGSLQRDSENIFHSEDIFNSRIKGEHEFERYIKYLENMDINLTKSMIPLGSCTMKLNSATEMAPLSWPKVANLHPFVPKEQAQGYLEMFEHLETLLKEVTKMDGVSFQPNSGATGEYCGLLAIRHYQKQLGQGHRDVVLIPNSAHGTNPASARKAGLKVVVIKSDADGNVDFADLKNQCEKFKDALSSLMITYPSTHGVFEAEIKNITELIHSYGGQVYMDGANMNAQCG